MECSVLTRKILCFDDYDERQILNDDENEEYEDLIDEIFCRSEFGICEWQIGLDGILTFEICTENCTYVGGWEAVQIEITRILEDFYKKVKG